MKIELYPVSQQLHQFSDFSKAIPWELWVSIFSYLGPKSIPTLSFVCKNFNQFTKNQGLWHVFCRSLSLFQENVAIDDFCTYYQKLSNFERNLQARDAYIPIPHSFPRSGRCCISNDLLCFSFYPIEIYSDNGNLLSVLECDHNDTTSSRILNLFLPILDSLSQVDENLEEETSQKRKLQISHLVQEGEDILPKDLIERIKEAQAKGIVDQIMLYEAYGFVKHVIEKRQSMINDFVMIHSFAASQDYFAIAHLNMISIWDRHSFQKISCLLIEQTRVVSMTMLGRMLFILYESNLLETFDVNTNARFILKEKALLLRRFSDDTVAFVSSENEIIFLDTQGLSKRTEPFNSNILNLCFDDKQEKMAVILNDGSNNALMVYSFKNEKEFSLSFGYKVPPITKELMWKHGTFWMETNNALLKVLPRSYVEFFSPIAMNMTCSQYTWLEDRLFYISKTQFSETHLLDFSGSRKEIEAFREQEDNENTMSMSDNESSSDSELEDVFNEDD